MFVFRLWMLWAVLSAFNLAVAVIPGSLWITAIDLAVAIWMGWCAVRDYQSPIINDRGIAND